MDLGIEIYFAGQKYYINSDRQQILSLLLSTYETAVEKNNELLQTQEALKGLNERLEERVTERNASLLEIRKLSEDLARRNVELEAANRELDAFAYSVSHDLRAPLRSIDGFSKALLDEYADKIDATGLDFLRRVSGGAQRMALLIDDILKLSRITRGEMQRESMDLSTMARSISEELSKTQPERRVEFSIMEGVDALGDPRLLHAVLENLLGNAWKFSARKDAARIEFGKTEIDGRAAFFVRDNGAGFDMAYADRLFVPFQRLHTSEEFAGTGIGLSIVQRVIRRHGGDVWAEGEIGGGATFMFTLSGC
jgi:light-regulated signal transduction histidine kinase (bacteriophytochrome)